MISNLTITGFRAFRELRVDPLTRVNLFVGKNNAGKTSILEAAELVAAGTFSALPGSLRRRGEEFARPNGIDFELDPSHLFYGHGLHIGRSFSIRGAGEIERWVECEFLIEEPSDSPAESTPSEAPTLDLDSIVPLLRFQSHTSPEPRRFRLSSLGGLRLRGALSLLSIESVSRVNFLGTATPNAHESGKLWDMIVLTPEEEGIASALRIIEPRIERIAFIGETRRERSIFLKLSGSDQRLPLGSAGDGLKRLLNLTLHLSSARGGFLMVDEIDTGLHYSVLADMWKLVIETAKRLNVQVFATTHSLDCVHALAWVQEQNPSLASEVTLHRVEKDAPATVVYSMDEIAIAERGQIEVR